MGSISMLLTVIAVSVCIGIASGIAGGVYRLILAYEPVLGWWFKWGNRFDKKWFFAPVWGCFKCVSGQLALWVSLGGWVLPAYFERGGTIASFGVSTVHFTFIASFGLILAITMAVLFSLVVAKAIQNFEK